MKCKEFYKKKRINSIVHDYARLFNVRIEKVEIGKGEIIIHTKGKCGENVFLFEKMLYEEFNEKYVIIVVQGDG